ncbi:tetratricopeptide repeat protein [Rubellimicrobium aerolatum]|uniref:Tetratricopeptide repeat protein n=1 Tax=Rubellimicrobium aerolatum TaxID=490979 RepID=A0ABW0S9I0_9RHOB|nr:tetratricopeptide repeat protein [Rubellimicrobium aerolatum]MBP1804934.1 tetratricopeptide (TPR) repeat protein [Rubellimicrobium aerolatum]
MLNRSGVILAAALSSVLVLSGCESQEDKAERFYRSALALIEQGDEDRALVELRNVFDNDGFHQEARMAYADINLRRGNVTEAYRHYLLLAEQYPDLGEVRLTLAELAIEQGNWDEAERHGAEALRLLPDDLRAQAVDLALRYHGAVMAGDEARQEEVARQARILLAAHDELGIARRVVIHRLVSGPNPVDAVPVIDRALQDDPDSLDLHMTKFRALVAAEDMDGTGAQLREMYRLFPDNEEVRSSLVRWHLIQGDSAGAEALLRELAGDPTGATGGFVTLIDFIRAARGADAARAEIESLVKANEGTANADLYRTLLAGLDYEAGKADEAVAAIEAVLETAPDSDQTRRIKTTLARMLSDMGNRVGARQRVEEVLEVDQGNVDALKLRAAWAIDEDRPGDAIVDLRTALSQEPRDIEVLTLMAEAHQRDGDLDLAGERLSAAAEVSNFAVEPSLRYAEFLLAQGQATAAETVLSDSRAANPASVEVALRLGQLWLGQNNLPGVEQVAAQLDAIGSDAAKDAAQRLRAGLAFSSNRTEDGLEMLRTLADQGGGAEDVARAVSAMLRTGSAEEARDFLDQRLSDSPDDFDLRLLDAGLMASEDRIDESEALLRELIALDPTSERATMQLYTLLARTNRAEEATAVLDAGLAASPGSQQLSWMKAAELERSGDIDGAIAIYQSMYDANSFNVVVANNLASLLSQRASSAEDLDRAFAIAKRLEDSREPALMDTYGWILAQRGQHAEALPYLEGAAESLGEDPVVSFHLGMTYHALGRTEEARAALTRALDLAGDRPIPQMATARETLAALPAAPAGLSSNSSAAEPASAP